MNTTESTNTNIFKYVHIRICTYLFAANQKVFGWSSLQSVCIVSTQFRGHNMMNMQTIPELTVHKSNTLELVYTIICCVCVYVVSHI